MKSVSSETLKEYTLSCWYICPLLGWGRRMCWMTCFSRAVPQNYRDTVSLAAALNLAQRKFFPISVMYFSLIISVDTWDQGPWEIQAVRLEIPLNPATSQSSYMTRLPTVCTWPETPQCGDLQAQLCPSLTCLMWIQATQTLTSTALCWVLNS